VYAGRTVEGGHADAGIIRERRQAAGAAGVSRFGERILDEGEMRLVCVADA
jgi:hypothetical protein